MNQENLVLFRRLVIIGPERSARVGKFRKVAR